MAVAKSAGILFLVPFLMAKCDPLNLGDATENVKKSAEALERGMKGLDPIALKNLIERNERLQASLNEVTAAYSKYGAQDGVIVLKGQDLMLRFKSRVGSMTVNAWVDDQTNKIIYNQTVAKGDTYNFWPPTRRGPSGGGAFADVINNLPYNGDEYRGLAVAAFEKFLATADFTPLPDIGEIYLNQTLRTVGAHKIYISVKPVAKVGDKWSITGELFIRNTDKTERQLKVFTINNEKVDEVALLIDVKSGENSLAIPGTK